jgi:hypothetical protein
MLILLNELSFNKLDRNGSGSESPKLALQFILYQRATNYFSKQQISVICEICG